MLRKRDINSFQYKKISEKIFSTIYPQKKKMEILTMQKKFDHENTTVEIDPLSGEYYTVIPEWVIHDMNWYEGSEISFDIESDEVIIRDAEDE